MPPVAPAPAKETSSAVCCQYSGLVSRFMLMLVADRVMSRAKIHSVHPMASPSRRRTSRHSTPAAKTGSVTKSRATFSNVTAREIAISKIPASFCRWSRRSSAAGAAADWPLSDAEAEETVGLRFRGLPGLSFHQLIQCDAEHLSRAFTSLFRSGMLPSVSHLLTDCREIPQLFRQGVLRKSSLVRSCVRRCPSVISTASVRIF